MTDIDTLFVRSYAETGGEIERDLSLATGFVNNLTLSPSSGYYNGRVLRSPNYIYILANHNYPDKNLTLYEMNLSTGVVSSVTYDGTKHNYDEISLYDERKIMVLYSKAYNEEESLFQATLKMYDFSNTSWSNITSWITDGLVNTLTTISSGGTNKTVGCGTFTWPWGAADPVDLGTRFLIYDHNTHSSIVASHDFDLGFLPSEDSDGFIAEYAILGTKAITVYAIYKNSNPATSYIHVECFDASDNSIQYSDYSTPYATTSLYAISIISDFGHNCVWFTVEGATSDATNFLTLYQYDIDSNNIIKTSNSYDDYEELVSNNSQAYLLEWGPSNSMLVHSLTPYQYLFTIPSATFKLNVFTRKLDDVVPSIWGYNNTPSPRVVKVNIETGTISNYELSSSFETVSGVVLHYGNLLGLQAVNGSYTKYYLYLIEPTGSGPIPSSSTGFQVIWWCGGGD